jgi:polyferredoxin
LINLLRFKPLRSLVRSRFFPLIPQLLMLTAYIGLIAVSYGIKSTVETGGNLTKTNLASQLIWNYWWPVILVLAVFAGRLWCMVCPLELISFLAEKVGLGKKPPRWMKGGWPVTVFYSLILFVAMPYLGLDSEPHSTAIYLAIILGMVLVLGSIWKGRTFCSFFCPVGSLLGMYSYVAATEWRADNPEMCARCGSKKCTSGSNRTKFFGRSCTSRLYPAQIPDNRECLLCTQCAKTCPDSNFRFSIRMPMKDFFTNIRLKPAEMVLLLIVIGFVNSSWQALVLFILMPLLVCLWFAKSRMVMLNAFLVLLIPVNAVAHVLHSFNGIIWNWPFIRLNIADPIGISTAVMMRSKLLEIDWTQIEPALRLKSYATPLLYALVFAGSLAVIILSPVTARLNLKEKWLLVISLILYQTSFFIKF